MKTIKKRITKTKSSVKKSAIKKTSKSFDKITKEMTISDVVKKYPQTIEVFFNYELHCVGCFAAEFDTVESGAKVHGVNVEHLLYDLNKKIA